MSYRPTKLGVLVALEPEAATRRILAAFRKARGRALGAAAVLGVDRRTLNRWIERLGLRGQLGNDSEAA